MYGNTAGRTWLADATIGTGTGNLLVDMHVTRRGQARLNRSKVPATGVTEIEVDVSSITDADGNGDINAAIIEDDNTVHLVSEASGRTTTDSVTVAAVYADENKFRGSDNNLYSYCENVGGAL